MDSLRLLSSHPNVLSTIQRIGSSSNLCCSCRLDTLTSALIILLTALANFSPVYPPSSYYSQSCALHFWNIQIYFTNLNKNMREGGDLISAASPQNFIKSIWITVTQTHKGSHLVNSITLACFYIALYRCIVLRIFLSLKLSGHFQMSL